MQGTRFGIMQIGGKSYLSAAHGTSVFTSPLTIHSISVENSLHTDSTEAQAAEAVPPVNKMLNYVHSMCDRFPLDDALSAVQARVGSSQARTVHLRMCCGAQHIPVWSLYSSNV